MNENSNGFQLLEELEEYIPVMTREEIEHILDTAIAPDDKTILRWQSLLLEWKGQKEDFIGKIKEAYAKQR